MKFIFLILFSMLTVSSLAQLNFIVKGEIADTASNVKLENASISILNQKDSTLAAFTWADVNGGFTFNHLKKGKFLFLITYPSYADYVGQFILDSSVTVYNLGRINMIPASKILSDVIIRGTRPPIRIRGDTTEYNADAFVVQPNAKVEDLLKQFPGIQVDKDGKITAQGQTVTKVLVDGEEFFGDDPTLVTRNIRADMVNKIQLYDQKSEQAKTTGIDDGQKTKTINVVLKEDKKSGYFGKADAGVGTQDYYIGQVLFNSFQAKSKFSTYVTSSNDGTTGLGWQDSKNIGILADNAHFGDNGSDLGSFNGQYTGQGLPEAYSAGVHYDDKSNDNNSSINANYKIGSLDVTGNNNMLTQDNLPGNIIKSNSNEVSDNSLLHQKFDIKYKLKLDTTSDVEASLTGIEKNSHVQDTFSSTSLDGNGIILNSDNRNIDNKENTQIVDASLFYRKKFGYTGRILSVAVDYTFQNVDSKGFLKSNIIFPYQSISGDSSQLIDQYQSTTQNKSAFNANVNFTEPFSKYFLVLLSYSLGIDNGIMDRKSFNQSQPGIYNVLVDSLSSDYKLNQLTNEVGAIFNLKNKKTNFNFGTQLANMNFDQIDQLTNNDFKRNFIDWKPQANFQYNFSVQKFFNISYNGNTIQPDINQLQPVAINTDPLNIIVGNPYLTPSFSHDFSFRFLSFKVLNNQAIFINANYVLISNPIVSNQVTDSTGKSITQYLNLPGKEQSDLSFNISISRKLSGPDLSVALGFNVSGQKLNELSNSEINVIKAFNYSPGLQLVKEKANAYDLVLRFSPVFTVSQSSLQAPENNNSNGFDASYSSQIYLWDKFQLSSTGSFTYRGKSEVFNTDFHRTLINGGVSRTFLTGDKLKVSILCNDLLNENVGFNRNISNNLLTQDSYSTIKRYFMLSIVYDFNKMDK